MIKEKILVIDDEESTLHFFDLYLKLFGYEALLAKDGEEGLELFKEYQPDIVITDIKMPGIDGMVVLREIKKIKPYTEVIVITGHGDLDLAVKALNLDATDFLNKPIGRESIENAIKRAQERLKLFREKRESFDYDLSEKEAKIYIKGPVNGITYHILENIWKEVLKQDIKKVSFYFHQRVSINGAGISCFVDIAKQAKESDIKLVFVDLPKHFEEIFQNLKII